YGRAPFRVQKMPSASLLLIEDRDSLRRMLARALAGEGYEVEAASTGREGIAALEGRPYDLVLTDLKLPDATGLDVLAASRAAQPATPVIVLPGFGTGGPGGEGVEVCV